MDAFVVEGPTKLSGTVTISGSKNSALPFLFASILMENSFQFTNVPRLWDIETTLELLGHMGTESEWDREAGVVELHPKVTCSEAPYEWVKKMRAGILALGPLLAKTGEAKVSLPGGCAIGARPVNFHLEAMKRMGVSFQVEEGYIHGKAANGLRGAEINFPKVTVTGTENLLTVAVLAEGKTTLTNAAREPEVVALGNFLQACGAKISGLGTAEIQVEGVSSLRAPSQVPIPPDRIETGTWLAIAQSTRSPLTLEKCNTKDLEAVLDAYRRMGMGLEVSDDGSRIAVTPATRPEPLDLETQPYPGFPTDMQAQIMVNLCSAEGTSHMKETIFENRFMHVAELRRLGAKIRTYGNLATVEGPVVLKGAPIMATDLRASASLVVAALAAEGTSRISRIYHLDRGYQRLDEKLVALGAKVQRVTE